MESSAASVHHAALGFVAQPLLAVSVFKFLGRGDTGRIACATPCRASWGLRRYPPPTARAAPGHFPSIALPASSGEGFLFQALRKAARRELAGSFLIRSLRPAGGDRYRSWRF